MVTVRQLIEKLQGYDDDNIITISSKNDDGAAEAYLNVVKDNIHEDTILGHTDYYNSDEVELL